MKCERCNVEMRPFDWFGMMDGVAESIKGCECPKCGRFIDAPRRPRI